MPLQAVAGHGGVQATASPAVAMLDQGEAAVEDGRGRERPPVPMQSGQLSALAVEPAHQSAPRRRAQRREGLTVSGEGRAGLVPRQLMETLVIATGM